MKGVMWRTLFTKEIVYTTTQVFKLHNEFSYEQNKANRPDSLQDALEIVFFGVPSHEKIDRFVHHVRGFHI